MHGVNLFMAETVNEGYEGNFGKNSQSSLLQLYTQKLAHVFSA